jgi:hypothetical protein
MLLIQNILPILPSRISSWRSARKIGNFLPPIIPLFAVEEIKARLQG